MSGKSYSSNAHIWRVVDNHWRCVSHDEQVFLSDYLWSLGFNIPESITYCIAINSLYRLKYRVYGGCIYTYITNLKTNTLV